MSNTRKSSVVWSVLALLLAGLIINAGALNLGFQLSSPPDARWAVMLVALLAIAYGTWLIIILLRQDSGDERMRALAGHIQRGAQAFLRREYGVLMLFTAAVAGLLALLIHPRPWVSVGYVLGTLVSAGRAGLG